MRRLNIILLILLPVLILSCNKEMDNEILMNEIESFSGLKINPKMIDSVEYESNLDIYNYVLYLSDANLKKLYLESQKVNGFEFYSHMDSFSSFTVTEKNCMKQLNINLTQKWVVYGEVCH